MIKLSTNPSLFVLIDMPCNRYGGRQATQLRAPFIPYLYLPLSERNKIYDMLGYVKVRGKVYTACIRSAMLHGSETCEPNTPDIECLRHNDCATIRWICGTKDQDETPAAHYSRNLALRISRQSFAVGGLDGMIMYSVQRPVSNLSPIYRFLAPEGEEGLQRHGLKVQRLMSANVAWLLLSRQDRDAWRADIRRRLMMPTSLDGTRTAP